MHVDVRRADATRVGSQAARHGWLEASIARECDAAHSAAAQSRKLKMSYQKTIE